ncbi:MAG: hypothetical protein AMXMBFR13_28660 [Phycisphaerae bacterium]
MLSWREFSDWAKVRPATLRLADALGRGRRRLCLLDHVAPPAPAPCRPRLDDWDRHELAAAWLGHGTALLRIAGMNVLTDSVFSNRVGLDLGLVTGGPRRLVAPAISMCELPPIDLVLVSHAHFDHLDRPSLGRLPKRVPILTSRHNSDLIADLGFRSVQELNWGESAQVDELTVTAWPVIHWGARTFNDLHRGYCAFLIEGGGRRVLFGGDTAYGQHFKDMGGVDLAILGIGAYDPYVQAHATPEQAWKMADDMRAESVLPMHHGTFRLSHEPTGEPIERFQEAAGGDESRIALRRIGEMFVA